MAAPTGPDEPNGSEPDATEPQEPAPPEQPQATPPTAPVPPAGGYQPQQPMPPQGAPQPMGPGWWQASDGLFYPPAGPPQKKSGAGKGCLIALGVVGGLFVLMILAIAIVAAAGGGDDDEASDDSSAEEAPQEDAEAAPADEGSDTTQAPDEGSGDDPNPGELFPGRTDTQSEDQERNIGEAARLSGYTTTVNVAEFVPQVSDFETSGYIHINVTTVNRDETAQPYNLFDWRLQTPGGQVIDPTFVTASSLESGDLVGGGEVTGDVYFDVGGQTGEFFVIYKPDAFDAARGIWSVTI